MNKTKIKYNQKTDMVKVELEKQYWLKKVKRNLDKRRSNRDFMVFEVMELDKCLQTDDYYVNTFYKRNYGDNDYFLKSLEKKNRQ